MTRVRCSTVATHVTSLPAYPPSAQIARSPGTAGDQGCQDRFGPIAVLYPRRMDHHDEEQPEDIDHDMALAAVIASDPPFSVVFTV